MFPKPYLLFALASLVFAFCATAQGLPGNKQLPSVSFTTPDGADTSGDPHEWMLKPEFRKDLNKQMLRLSHVQDGILRSMDGFWPARAMVERFFDMGPDYAYLALLEDDALYLSYGHLFLASQGKPFFDPADHTPFVTPTLEGFALSPSGNTLAVTVGNGGTEIAIIKFVDMETGMVRDVTAGPVVVGGDMGFSWLDDTTGLFRKAATTNLVQGDPSEGAEWTLLDVRTGQTGAHVFGPSARGVKSEYGDWFGLWVPSDSDVAMGYLWRGNFIDAYVADLKSVRAGNPEWREVGADLLLSDVEVWNNRFVITATDARGQSVLYTQSLSGGPLRQLAKGEGDVSYLFTTSLGDIAYVAARHGDTHQLYRLSGHQARLEPVALPFIGEIDFDSMFGVKGSPNSITFDLSAPNEPWRLMRLDQTGPAYPIEVAGLAKARPAAAMEAFAWRKDLAVSKDATDVPVSVLTPAALNQSAPAIIHVYGSYGETTMAGWNPSALAWVGLGGVYAECHVRGSGYYGPSWHADGSGPDKARAHEDMVACAEHLIESGLAEPGKIAALGGSAGGLIAGPVSLKRPDLFGAAIVEFGVVNPLRSLDGPNGATQIDEFGDPRKPEDASLMATSDSVELARTVETVPSVFLCVGFQDSRVPHWMSARLAAVLAERGFGDRVVIHADADAGHSCGFYTEDQRDALAKQYAWLLNLFADGSKPFTGP
ncbi:MAG: prolyl oligopeptidase family serine peptidase [Pseudomonadota bacterium]